MNQKISPNNNDAAFKLEEVLIGQFLYLNQRHLNWSAMSQITWIDLSYLQLMHIIKDNVKVTNIQIIGEQ